MIKKDTVLSQSDLNECNSGKRSSDVLLSTIEELERTKKQLKIAEHAINYAMMRCENCYGMVCQYCHLNYCITYYKDKERVNK